MKATIRVYIALLLAAVMLVPGMLVITENASADVFGAYVVTNKPDAYKEHQQTYEKTMVKVYRHNNDAGVSVAVVTAQTSGTWLGPLSTVMYFDTSSVGSQGDNSASRSSNDAHFYTTFYGYLPRGGQNYEGYGHVGTAGGYIDVDTGPENNAYATSVGSNYVNWQISNGGWQSSWNGVTQAASSDGFPSTDIQVYANYQTADWCVFWWNVHGWESCSFTIPASQYT